jgi:hypothetical protein
LFTPKDAIEKLAYDYDEEKKLIEGLQYPGSRFFEKLRNVSRLLIPLHYIRHYYYKARFERLEGVLKTYRVELDYSISKATCNDEVPAWGVHARELLDRAENELRNYKIDKGWEKLHAARRLHIYGYTKMELKEKSDTIRVEAEKLNEWRRKAIYELIGDADHPKKDVNADTLFRVARLRDEYYNNEYYKNRLVEDVFLVLLFSMYLWTAGIILYFFLIDIETLIVYDDGTGRSISTSLMVPGVLLFGLLGGCISSLFLMFLIRDSSKITRIPEIVSHHFATVVRVFIGGGSALVIFIFLESEFSTMLFQHINLQPLNPFTYFTISFVAGFTERLLLRAVSSV